MNYSGMQMARCILLKAFLIGLVMHLLFLGIVLEGQNLWIPMVSTFWHIPNSQWFWNIVVIWFATGKFFLFYILLIPGLAIHWTLKRLEITNTQ